MFAQRGKMLGNISKKFIDKNKISIIVLVISNTLFLCSCGAFQSIVRNPVGKISDPSYKLLVSVSENNLEGVKESLAEGADPNDIGCTVGSSFALYDRLSLSILLSENNLWEIKEVADLLIENGADVNGNGAYNMTMMQYISSSRDYVLIDLFIKHGVSMKTQGLFSHRMTPLESFLSGDYYGNPDVLISPGQIKKYKYTIRSFIQNGSSVTRKTLKMALSRCDNTVIAAPIILNALKDKTQNIGISKPLEYCIEGRYDKLMPLLGSEPKREEPIIMQFAAAFGPKYLLEAMHQKGYDFNSGDVINGLRLIDLASAFNGRDELQYLCSIVEDPYSVNTATQKTILSYATIAASSNEDWLTEFIPYSVGDMRDNKDNSDFENAVLSGNFESVEKMLKKGYTPDRDEILDAYSDAVTDNDIKCLKRMNSLDPFKSVITESEELMEMVEPDNLECINYLIDHDARISDDAMIDSAGSVNSKMLAKMIQKKEVDKETCVDMLQEAVMNGRFDNVKVLLDHGLDPAWTDGYGSTALHIAAESPSVNILRYLINHCKDVEQVLKMKDKNGYTPEKLARDAHLNDNLQVLKEA